MKPNSKMETCRSEQWQCTTCGYNRRNLIGDCANMRCPTRKLEMQEEDREFRRRRVRAVVHDELNNETYEAE